MSRPDPKAPEYLGWRLFAGALAASALSPLGSTMIAVALPTIGRDLAAPEAALTQWLAVSYLVVSLAGQAPGGYLSDRMGHVRALVVGVFINMFGAALGVFGANLATLAAARIIMAAGGAITIPAAIALIRSRAPDGSRSWAYGIFSALMASAAALGPPLGGELIAVLNWRATFAAGIPFAVVALLCLAKHESSSRLSNVRAPFDWSGTILLIAGLGLATTSATSEFTGRAGLSVLAAALLILFAARALRQPSAIIDPRIFARPGFAAGCIVIGAQNLAMYALLFQLPILFAAVGPLQASEMGYTLFAMMAGMMVSSLAGGWTASFLGLRWTALSGTVLSLAGWWLLGNPQQYMAPLDAFGPLLIVGCGIGLSTAPSQTASMEAVSRDQSGSAAGLVSMSRYLGAILGLSVMARLVSNGNDGSAAMTLNGVAFIAAFIAAGFLPARQRPGKLMA